MTGKIRLRLAVLIALAALTAVIVPATLASGDTTTKDAGIIYLSMGNSPSSDVITYGTVAPQPIPTKKNDCTAVDALNPGNAASILVVTEINALSLGEAKDHIGTKGPNDGNGEPCALAAAGAGVNGLNEGISVKLGQAAGNVLMDGFSIDIRLKSNGNVLATTYLKGTAVATDSFTVTGPDNAPDSRDNFRWTYQAAAGKEFDEVRFMATTGDFALGGGAASKIPGGSGFNQTSYASQFGTVTSFDGEIECQPDSAAVGNSSQDLTYGTVVMRAENLNNGTGWLATGCRKKPYQAGVGVSALYFRPFDPAGFSGTSARYTLDVYVKNQPIETNASGQIISLIAEYDPAGSIDFPAGTGMPLKACNFVPPTTVGGTYTTFWTQAPPVDQAGLNLLPTSQDIACFFGASVEPTGVSGGKTIGTEHWLIYFEGDPGWSFK